MARGGAMGFLGYDLGRYLERIPDHQPEEALPQAYLGFYDLVVAVDHVTGETWLVSTGHPEGSSARARARLVYLRALAQEALQSTEGNTGGSLPPAALRAHFSRSSYCAAVERAKEYITAGDIYQVNLSQRLWMDLPAEPMRLYNRLRDATPVPFGAYLSVGEETVLCASPELFLRVRGTAVETRPIKGTRARGRSAWGDRRLARELARSGKDRSELMMVVDLERNDLSRVCLPGTVTVPRLCGLESYANVHHLAATVIGTLKPGLGIVDLLQASFPGGSITGVPKIRAMEIIAELEPVRRGVYTGSIGWLGFDGDAELNIAIRTAWTDRGRLCFQVGGAVTADSDPGREYDETLHKAAGLFSAVGYDGRRLSAGGLVLD